MTDFFAKLQEALKTLKLPIVGFIGLIALIQIFVAAFFSNEDRRQTIAKIIGLMIFAGFIMYSDRFFAWIAQIFQ